MLGNLTGLVLDIPIFFFLDFRKKIQDIICDITLNLFNWVIKKDIVNYVDTRVQHKLAHRGVDTFCLRHQSFVMISLQQHTGCFRISVPCHTSMLNSNVVMYKLFLLLLSPNLREIICKLYDLYLLRQSRACLIH